MNFNRIQAAEVKLWDFSAYFWNTPRIWTFLHSLNVGSVLVQTINVIILYMMRMRTEAKRSYDYLMHRPIVGQLIVYCPTGKCRSADRKILQFIKVIGEICLNVISPVWSQ